MNKDIAIDGTMDLSKRSPLEAPATINESALRNIIRECIINMFENLDEKAKSKAQQRFMGMVHAVQKGELDADEVGASVAKAAKTMKKKDAKDFAETKHKGLPNHVSENQLVKLIKESIQEELVDVLAKYTKGEATAEEANKAIMNLANSSNMKLNENEFDELNISTMQSAHDKMQRNGQYDRSSKLATRSWKIIYDSLADNLVIYKSLWGINVADPNWTKYNYTFDINTCQWSPESPRFVDRKAAVILANLIRKECGERAGDFGNKAMYIK